MDCCFGSKSAFTVPPTWYNYRLQFRNAFIPLTIIMFCSTLIFLIGCVFSANPISQYPDLLNIITPNSNYDIFSDTNNRLSGCWFKAENSLRWSKWNLTFRKEIVGVVNVTQKSRQRLRHRRSWRNLLIRKMHGDCVLILMFRICFFALEWKWRIFLRCLKGNERFFYNTVDECHFDEFELILF